MLPRKWRVDLTPWSVAPWSYHSYVSGLMPANQWILEPWSQCGRIYIGLALHNRGVSFAFYDVFLDKWDTTNVALLPEVNNNVSTQQITVAAERESIFLNTTEAGIFEGVASDAFKTVECDIASNSHIVWMEGELHMLRYVGTVLEHRVWDTHGLHTREHSAGFEANAEMSVVRVGLSGRRLVSVNNDSGELYKYDSGHWQKLAVGALPGSLVPMDHYCLASSPCGRFVILSNPKGATIWVLDLEANNMWPSAARLPAGFTTACMTITRGLQCMSWLQQWAREECTMANMEILPRVILGLVAKFLCASGEKIAHELHVFERNGNHATIEMTHVLCACAD